MEKVKVTIQGPDQGLEDMVHREREGLILHGGQIKNKIKKLIGTKSVNYINFIPMKTLSKCVCLHVC